MGARVFPKRLLLKYNDDEICFALLQAMPYFDKKRNASFNKLRV